MSRDNQRILAEDFLNAFRAEVIEECAQVADNWNPGERHGAQPIAAAIRALKDSKAS